jgi:5-methylcytosine-specific restriction enzyme subunit McrC
VEFLINSQKDCVDVFENEETSEPQPLVKEIHNLAGKTEYLDKFLVTKDNYFKFKHHVGILQTDKYRVRILPKIWKDNCPGRDYARNLVKLLLYAFSGKVKTPPETEMSAEINDLDLFELLMRLYAITLEDQLSMGAYRMYNRSEEENRYLKGKLNLEKQLRKIDQSIFDISSFRFSGDNDLNRFFVYATDRFLQMTRDTLNSAILSSIKLRFDPEEVSNVIPKDNVNFNRLNERFQVPYTYAKLVLDGLIPLPGDDDKSLMMIFDMNVVFEEFFATFLRRNEKIIFKGIGSVKIIKPDSSRNFIYKKTRDRGYLIRYTKPDVIIRIGKLKFIFDTKYKILKKPEITEDEDNRTDEIKKISANDLYQMFTYSEIYDSKGIILVFPGSESKLSEPYRFKENGRFLWVYMVNLDLSGAEWEIELANKFGEDFSKINNNV